MFIFLPNVELVTGLVVTQISSIAPKLVKITTYYFIMKLYLFMDSKLVIIRVIRFYFGDFYFFKFVGGLNSSFLYPERDLDRKQT